MQIKIVALGATAVFLWAGSTASADFTHGGPVIDRYDPVTGLVYAHVAEHDFLIAPGTHGDPGVEPAHWSWVASSPTDAPTVTSVPYFIHSHVADPISATQLDRLHDAAAVWNTSGANVVLTEVFSDPAAGIHVHNDSTSGCSGGAIGCAAFSYFTSHNPSGYPPGSGHPEPAHAGLTHPQHLMGGLQTLTMLTGGVTWYSGSSSTVPVGEHDYMTVVIQEFGHHLGLTHPDDPGLVPHGDQGTSPMLSGLPPATSRRVLTGSDTDAIEHLYGVIPSPGALSLLALSGLVGCRRRRRSQ